jgi:hypothetical protein
MKIAPITKDLGAFYKQSNILNPTYDKTSLRTFLNRLRKFSRDSVVSAVGKTLWGFYRKDIEALNQIKIEKNLIESLGPLLISLAWLNCRRDKNEISGNDLEILFWELHEVWIPLPEIKPNDIKEELDGLGIKNEFNELKVFHFRAREIRRQMQHRMQTFANLIYSWGVFKEIEKLLDFNELKTIERTVLGLPALQFLRTGYSIFSMAQADKVSGGFVQIENSSVSPEVSNLFEITKEDLRVFVKRLSNSIKPDWKKIKDLQPHDLLKPEISFLNELPILELKDYSDEEFGKIVVPSPNAFFSVLSRFIDSIGLRTTSLPSSLNSQYLGGIRGKGFENFVKKISPPTRSIIWVDSLKLPSKKKGHDYPRPDLLWISEDFLIIIEMKFDVRPNADPNLISVKSMLNTWLTLVNAGKQAEEFINSKEIMSYLDAQYPGILLKKKVLIICTSDELSADGTSFLYGAKKWNFLNNSFTGLTTLSAIDLVELFRENNPNKVGELIVKHWQSFNGKMVEESRPSEFSNKNFQYEFSEYEKQLGDEILPNVFSF